LSAQAAVVVEAVVLAKETVGHNFRGDEYRYDSRIDAVFKGDMRFPRSAEHPGVLLAKSRF
jgi:hypothetical protein